MDNETNLTPTEEETRDATEMTSEEVTAVADAENEAPEELEPARFTAKTVLDAEVQLEASKTLAPKIGNFTGIIGIGLMVALLGVRCGNISRPSRPTGC